MHHKLILVLAFICVGCFFVVYFNNIWLIIIPLIFFLLIFATTKAQNLLKIFVPVSVIIIISAVIFNVSSGPSVKDLETKLNYYETEIIDMNKILKEKQEELSIEKKNQGWLKSTFNDSENVDILENKIEMIKSEIIKMDKEIITLKNEIRKKG
jgi:energy-coupling factor transporter transmembrane protein EcfT